LDEPIAYRTPLPAGRLLRWEEQPDGVRIWREWIDRTALWREVISVGVVLLLLLGGMAYLSWWMYAYGGGVLFTALIWRIILLIVLAVVLVRHVPSLLQNIGVVTTISVAGATLYWRKRNLWGEREYFWPLETVTLAQAEPLQLKVFRRNEPALNAFAMINSADLAEAALRLNIAIEKNRRQANG
jgi:hypothetical protein